MRLVVQTIAEETYTFTPNNGEAPVTLRSGLLRQWLREKAMDKVIDLTFPEQTLDEIIVQHGLEAPRMASMTMLEAQDPVIVGLWPGGTHILIDGGHRRWFWAKQGINTIRGWAVPLEVWRAFEFHPEEMPGVVYHHNDGSLLPHRRGK